MLRHCDVILSTGGGWYLLPGGAFQSLYLTPVWRACYLHSILKTFYLGGWNKDLLFPAAADWDRCCLWLGGWEHDDVSPTGSCHVCVPVMINFAMPRSTTEKNTVGGKGFWVPGLALLALGWLRDEKLWHWELFHLTVWGKGVGILRKISVIPFKALTSLNPSCISFLGPGFTYIMISTKRPIS